MCRYERVLSSVHSIENKFEFEKDGCESSSSGMGAWKNVEDFVFVVGQDDVASVVQLQQHVISGFPCNAKKWEK